MENPLSPISYCFQNDFFSYYLALDHLSSNGHNNAITTNENHLFSPPENYAAGKKMEQR